MCTLGSSDGLAGAAAHRSPKVTEVNVGRYKHVLVWEASEVRVQHRYAYSIADRPGVESDHLHSTHAAKLNSQCLQPQLRCLLVFNRHRSPRSSQVAADEETNCAQ